jgi:hypothetical protein
MVVIRGVRCTFDISSDVIYPIQPYLQKNLKTCNVVDVDMYRYDFNMNLRRVVIENAFGSLKNRWHILRHFNLKVDRVVKVVIACCVLHNYCFEWGTFELGPPNVATPQDNLQGFGDKLPIVREGEITKVEGEKLKIALFEQWLIDNPIEK